MEIKYFLTKAEYDHFYDANRTLVKVQAILEMSPLYDRELSIPVLTMYLVERERMLSNKLKEVAL